MTDKTVVNANQIYRDTKPLNNPKPRNVFLSAEHISLETVRADSNLDFALRQFREGKDLAQFQTKTYKQHGKPDMLLESVGVDHLHLPKYPSNNYMLLVHVCDVLLGEGREWSRVLFLRDLRYHPQNSQWVNLALDVADDVIDFHEKYGSCHSGYEPIELSHVSDINPENSSEAIWRLANARLMTLVHTPRRRCIVIGARTMGNVHIHSMRTALKAKRRDAS